jgi:hypothetical protein
MLAPVALAVHGWMTVLIAKVMGHEKLAIGDAPDVGLVDVKFVTLAAEYTRC